MRAVLALARQIVLPAAVWVGAISTAHRYQLTHVTPEITYVLISVFAAFWVIRSFVLCLRWPRADGIFFAVGQMVGLALFLWWPTLIIDDGLTLSLAGPSFGLPSETPYTDALINGVVLANRFLPLVLIASAIVLALGTIVELARKTETPSDPAPSNSMSKPVLPPEPNKKPVQTGYTEIPENPLDAFR